ncbi:zinc-dependent alcohol dehydrogenase family protein [Paludisphaera borealis]|uniref:2-haloacrylate reductase n=1 Tax=Paludisphaera borealis TaxID=1387353 RepID=A0A1U7CKF8_9BACT|nr:zinc-dependent alcohol dehydrogenase family protein [Paludisphaera borealis]APW59388.1 2-haloacrylate reductase [Paludisphaera borealis]
MKAAVFESFGGPSEVLRIRDVPTPEPGPGEVRVRMIASPINPSDLMVVEGRYGVLPTLPSTPGFEGVGVVDKAGPGLMGRLVVGKRVAVINSKGGNWAEYAVIPWRQARPIAADIPDDQAATFFVNPATALAMVRHVLKVPKGEWLLISAAGSTLGKMIIKLGKHDGFKTLCVVRRSEAKAELVALGADAVISSSEGSVPEQVRAITGGDGPRYALDPVGGEAGTAIFRSLGTGGRLIVYGSLTGQPIEVDPRLVISGRRVVEGFWLGFWMRDRSIPASLLLFREIAALIRNDVLTSEIGASYALDDIVPAVREAAAVGRGGKVLLKLPGSSS